MCVCVCVCALAVSHLTCVYMHIRPCAATCPLVGAFALYEEILLHMHIFVLYRFDERDGLCRRESGNYPVQIPYYTLPPTNLGG